MGASFPVTQERTNFLPDLRRSWLMQTRFRESSLSFVRISRTLYLYYTIILGYFIPRPYS